MGLANWITIARIALIPVFLFLSYGRTDAAAVGAFVIFIVASASDTLDGHLARRSGTESRLGAFLDPLADKLLIVSALFVLVDTRMFPLWAALLIVGREIAVQILRTQIVSGGGSLPASGAGKLKTVLQIVMVGYWLLPAEQIGLLHWITLVLGLGATLWSGIEYFVKRAPATAGRAGP